MKTCIALFVCYCILLFASPAQALSPTSTSLYGGASSFMQYNTSPSQFIDNSSQSVNSEQVFTGYHCLVSADKQHPAVATINGQQCAQYEATYQTQNPTSNETKGVSLFTKLMLVVCGIAIFVWAVIMATWLFEYFEDKIEEKAKREKTALEEKYRHQSNSPREI